MFTIIIICMYATQFIFQKVGVGFSAEADFTYQVESRSTGKACPTSCYKGDYRIIPSMPLGIHPNSSLIIKPYKIALQFVLQST